MLNHYTPETNLILYVSNPPIKNKKEQREFMSPHCLKPCDDAFLTLKNKSQSLYNILTVAA